MTKRPAVICHCQEHGFARLTKWATALFSVEDLASVSDRSWGLHVGNGRSYAAGRRDGSLTLMHRHVLAGETGQHVDHRNHDGLDNRRSNLRPCTPSQNFRNARKSARGTSRFKGVSVVGDKFVARIYHDGRSVWLGRFDKEIDAAKAYDHAASSLSPEFAATNASLGLTKKIEGES